MEDEDDLPQTCSSTRDLHTQALGHSDPPSCMQEGQEPPQHPQEGFPWIPATVSAAHNNAGIEQLGLGTQPACLGSLLGNTGALSSLTSHPGQCSPQLQPDNCSHNICTLQPLRAPPPLTPWVHWVLRQLDIFNLFLSIQSSPNYPETYSAFTEEILL